MSVMLTEEELKNIIEESGIEDIVIKSWYKEFLLFCPKGKMARIFSIKININSIFCIGPKTVLQILQNVKGKIRRY